ncbi:MAG: TolC family protein [Gemmataceae bacterium]
MGWRGLQQWLAMGLIIGMIGCQVVAPVERPPLAAVPDPATTAALLTPLTAAPIAPTTTGVPNVRTVLNPDAPMRSITLYECIALALEKGRAGNTALRVLAYDPAIVGTTIEQSLSRFDAIWQSSMIWNTTNEPVGLASQAILTRSPDFNVQAATLDSRLLKPLPTGGVAGITFRTDYQYSDLDSPVNPAYQPRLNFVFEQPLLQGAGVEINQLRESHPGGYFNNFIPRGTGPGILLARVSFDQSRARIAAQVQDMLLQVEEAYWQLYLSYWELYSREMALRQSRSAWQMGIELRKQGELTVQDLSLLEAQYHQFRSQRLDALGSGSARAGVLEAERRLRFVVGLPPEDGTRLMPADAPTTARFYPDWITSQAEALQQRPELMEIRQELKAAQLRLVRSRNYLLPDLRFFGNYDVNSIGNRLDGPGEENALRNLALNKYNNWSLGLRLETPIGFREAHAQVRRAELELARETARLADLEQQVVLQLQQTFREVIQFQERIPMIRARRLALARQYQALFELFSQGETAQTFVMIEAQKNWADALRDEQAAMVAYATVLAQFERRKGTLLLHNNVEIVEGPLPACVQERASDTIRQRSSALVLRQRALPATDPVLPGEKIVVPPLPAGWMDPLATEMVEKSGGK